MSRQVIRQPDGKYAVFSTGTDQWVMWDFTREQYIEHRAEQAAREAREDAARLLDEVDAGEVPWGGWTFAEANAVSKRHGGTVLDGPVDERLLAELEAQRSDVQ